MEELKNTDKKGISTKRKIGKTTYEVVVHFNENATETMQDKLTRIMLRELRRKSDEKKMILIKKSLTSSNRKGCSNSFLYTCKSVSTDDKDVLYSSVFKFIQYLQPVFWTLIVTYLYCKNFLLPFSIDA